VSDLADPEDSHVLPEGERSDPLWVSHFFRCVVGGPRSGSSALLVAGSSVPGKYKITKKYKQKKARSTRQMRVLKSPGSIFPFHTLSDHICIYIYCIYTGLLTNGENMTHHNATNA